MKFIQFEPYGVNSSKPFINVERVVSFAQISFNGYHGTEIKMDDGTSIRVGEWPAEVAVKLNSKDKTE